MKPGRAIFIPKFARRGVIPHSLWERPRRKA
nr:MAG TPA: hypothetical protein [Caudoviricetes sp.]